MELRDFIKVMRAHWRAVLVLVLATTVFAVIITAVTPRVYAANASGIVTIGTTGGPAEASLADTLAKSRAVSYVDVAETVETAQAAIEDLGITADPSELIKRITVTQPLDTVLIKVRATAASPTGAKMLADAWIRALATQIQRIEDPDDKGQAIRLVPLEAAAVPASPSAPNPPRNLAFGIAAGLLLGAAYAVVRSMFDRRIQDAEAVTRDFGVTVAGAIPQSTALVRPLNGRAPIVVSSPRGVQNHAAESFFKLRTNLRFMDIDHPPRVIVVTSPLPADGKSVISANLAVALAQAGESVVLIDGDLRRPVVAESFGLIEGVGLTDLLTGRATVDDVAQASGVSDNLLIIGAGDTPPNPSELLGSNAMRRLLESLRENHFVIVDAPPLLPVTDAAVLTANADGALIVVTAGKTLDTQLRGSLDHVDAVNGHTLGVIFNRVTSRRGSSGYYGGYGYYGGSYGKDQARDDPVTEPHEHQPAARPSR